MFSRKDFFRLFDGLLRISTGKTNAICAAKHLELVHVYHLTNPYTDLTNTIWGTKY